MTTRAEVVKWLTEGDGKNFCTMPYRHFAIEGNGDILPCCMGAPIKDGDTKLKIHGSTINEMMNHPARKEMVDAFDRGERYSNCSQCWDDNSEFSPRVRFSLSPYVIHDTVRAMQGEKLESKLTWLEIKPGNRCNLKCRICGVHNSSLWAKDAYALSNSNQPYKESHIYNHMKECEWIDENRVWEDVSGLEDVDCIHLMGGEPFMIDEHFSFLEKFDNQYGIENVVLWYNTNGTFKIPDRYFDLFKRAKEVKLSISCDDIYHRYEYERKGKSWEESRETISWLFALNDLPNFSVLMDLTVSIYNVYYLNDIVDFCVDNQWIFNGSPSHFVDNNSYNNIRTLKPEQKKVIIEHLQNGKYANHKLITNAIEFMQQDMWNDHYESMRVARVTKLDELRTERFDQVFPEMNDIIGIYK